MSRTKVSRPFMLGQLLAVFVSSDTPFPDNMHFQSKSTFALSHCTVIYSHKYIYINLPQIIRRKEMWKQSKALSQEIWKIDKGSHRAQAGRVSKSQRVEMRVERVIKVGTKCSSLLEQIRDTGYRKKNPSAAESAQEQRFHFLLIHLQFSENRSLSKFSIVIVLQFLILDINFKLKSL